MRCLSVYGLVNAIAVHQYICLHVYCNSVPKLHIASQVVFFFIWGDTNIQQGKLNRGDENIGRVEIASIISHALEYI